MSCCDPKVLTRNLELNDCLSCIVYDLPTKRLPKFLPKLQLADVKTMDVKKFDVIVRTAENLQGLIAADLAVDTGT